MRVVAVVLGLLAGAGLIEAGLRIAGWTPVAGLTLHLFPLDEPAVCYQCYDENPHGEFSPAPDVSRGRWELLRDLAPPQPVPLAEIRAVPWCVQYRQSSLGIRDREYVGQGGRTPDVRCVRIACAGDSFVFGTGVPLERTLPRQLETALGGGVEVVNVGQVGADADRKLENLRRVAAAVKADRALFVWIPDDYAMPAGMRHRLDRLYDLFYVRRDPARGGIRLYELLKSRLDLRRVTRETIRLYTDASDPVLNPAGVARMKACFDALASPPDRPAAVVLYPLMIDLGDDYPLALAHERTAALARAAGLPVLDLREAFRNSDAESLRVHPVDHHPGGEAHGIAARAIADWLRRDPRWLSAGR